MIGTDIILALIPSIGVAVGVWVSLNSELAKLKGRVYHLEADRDELKGFMHRTTKAIEDIRIILAGR